MDKEAILITSDCKNTPFCYFNLLSLQKKHVMYLFPQLIRPHGRISTLFEVYNFTNKSYGKRPCKAKNKLMEIYCISRKRKCKRCKQNQFITQTLLLYLPHLGPLNWSTTFHTDDFNPLIELGE